MKIYTAERHYDYEGFTILGVFSTAEAAKAACEKDKDRGDDHEVNEYTLDELIL
jgi:hypothetical protein